MTKSAISKEMVCDVARLARLNPSPEEIDAYREHLDAILGYVRELDQLNLDDVEPTSYVHSSGAALRPDHRTPCLTRADALDAAPDPIGEGFGVPKVLESEP